jgi:non-lysosomal glucosylceramidase
VSGITKKIAFCIAAICFIFVPLFSATTIPSQAWSRDINAGGYEDGAPIGGLGAGTITWRLNGNFYKDRLNIAGLTSGGNGVDNEVFTDDPNAKFFLYQKPASGSATVLQLDAANLGTGQANYYSLFPKSWVDYYGSKFTVKSRVTQFSPIIPNDYQRVSYPVGIYEWDLSNPTSGSVDAAIMLTWQNNFSGSAAAVSTSGTYTGLVLKGVTNPTARNQGEFCVAAAGGAGVTVSYMSSSSLAGLTTEFSAAGVLSNTVGANNMGAIAFKVTLAPNTSVKIPIVLSWDIPIAQPSTGPMWYREYTRYFSRSGTNSWALALDALTNAVSYESQIDSWQNGILANAYYPDWLKTMLFNELYVYFTNGTLWEAGAASGQADDPTEDMFSHLESYIYEFYGTSDVRFYGSWALFLNWPNIDKQCLRQFSDSISTSRTDRPAPLGTCAHDFGDLTNVFQHWNAYIYRDSTTWKDLNSKFVLMVYRDYLMTGGSDTTFLTYCWNSVKIAMNKVHSQCAADGLPQSAGIDQTYDDLGLTGTTAYCGSLFLAACQAAIQIANSMGDATSAATYQGWFNTAQASFESELWTGTYYKIDTGSTAPTRIMSDQLCGQWYSKALGLGGVVSDAHAISAWQKVYDNNFSKFTPGIMCNVMTAAGAIDTSTSQSQEGWVGTTWGAVSGMVLQQMTAQANTVGSSIYNTIWNTAQYWFRTPEAWCNNLTNPRAFYYMRGSTVWGGKQAYDMLPSACGSQTCTPPPTNTATSTPTPTATVNPCAASYIRVNCGGPAATDSLGRTWAADQAYTTGSWGYINRTGVEGIVTNAIANTNDDVLYQSGSYGATLEYKFTVPKNGPWRVILKFAEIYYASSGSRVFNVFINGTQALSNFDIVGVTGAEFTAVDYTYDINVTNTVIDITTTAVKDNPVLSAIEILDASVVCSPTATITGTPPSPTYTATKTPTMTNTPYYSPTSTRTNTPYFSPTTTLTYTITPTYTSTPVFSSLRVDCAGPQYTDGSGNVWLADQAYGGMNTWGYTIAGTANNVADAIGGTTDDILYDNERWNATLGYEFDGLPNGSYQVTLKFAELWYGIAGRGGVATGTGSRVFNATIEGTQVLTNFDIFKTAGAADFAVDETFTVTVTGGVLTINLPQGTVDNPTIEAIQILRVMPTPTPSSTITKTGTITPVVSPTITGTYTCTATQTYTSTATATSTATLSWTFTATQTMTATATFTPTQSWTSTATATRTMTGTAVIVSATNTMTSTNSPTWTASVTGTYTATPTGTSSYTFTSTQTRTSTQTFTATPTATISPTFSVSPTVTATITGTPPSVTATPTFTLTYTYSRTFTATSSLTATASFTDTMTNTVTLTASPTLTFTTTFTITPADTALPTSTYTQTLLPSPANTSTFTATPTMTAAATATISPLPTGTDDKESIVYPNPYSPETGDLNVAFVTGKALPEITFKIYTRLFRLVRVVKWENVPQGYYTGKVDKMYFDGFSNGIYYYTIVSDDKKYAIGKILLLK